MVGPKVRLTMNRHCFRYCLLTECGCVRVRAHHNGSYKSSEGTLREVGCMFTNVHWTTRWLFDWSSSQATFNNTFTCSIVLRKYNYVLAFYTISSRWDDTDSSKLFSWKTRTYLYHIIVTMVDDCLAKQGGKAPLVITFTYFARNISDPFINMD